MKPKINVVQFSLSLFLSLLLASLGAQPSVAAPPRYLFGVINDLGDPEHVADESARGVRATTLELQWKRYEPQQGVYDSAYINQLQQLMRTYKTRGWAVQLVPGFHYTPDWVYTTYPDVVYVNQYGDRYVPDPVSNGDYRVINAPFNPQARALVAGYLARIFADFDQSDPLLRFDSVRVGGGVQGELRYPPQFWNGHTNSYWAFDAYAQDPASSGIPPTVVGWRPGIDPNPGTLGHGQLIINARFESAYPAYPIPGWSPDDPVQARVTANNPHAGARALELAIDSPHRIHQVVRVEPSTIYEAAAWLRSADGSGYARLFLEQYSAANEPIPGAPFLKLESNTAGWTHQGSSLTTSPDTRFFKVELDGDRPGTFFFDDLSLKRAGDPDDRDRQIDVPLSFYDWYVERMTDYQNWQLAQVRQYTGALLDVVYAGKGVRLNQITDALTNDLLGDGWSESSSGLYAAADYNRHVDGLAVDGPAALYVTGIERPSPDLVDDTSPYPSDWSAARWIAHLARARGLAVWGENTGENTAAELQVAARRMHANGFIGLLWGFESELYAGGAYATIDDYQATIARYANLKTIAIPAIHKRSAAPIGADIFASCRDADWALLLKRCVDLLPASLATYCPGLPASRGTLGQFALCLASAIVG